MKAAKFPKTGRGRWPQGETRRGSLMFVTKAFCWLTICDTRAQRRSALGSETS
jgi:hypothetical protein